MASKSEIAVLDVLHKNETKSADMVDILREQQSYPISARGILTPSCLVVTMLLVRGSKGANVT
jgi:hypothetical protein